MPYGGDPANDASDAVRFLVGDTDTNDELLSDNEVLFAIQQKGEGYGAAWFCAKALAAKFSRQVTSSAGKLSITASDKSKAFLALADSLYKMLAANVKPVFGGVTIAQKQALDANTGLVQPSFTKNQFDNPEASQENNRPIVFGGGQ